MTHCLLSLYINHCILHTTTIPYCIVSCEWLLLECPRTPSGRVYHWGLVHVSNGTTQKQSVSSSKSSASSSSSSLSEYEQVTAGQLTGLAENQEDVIVQVDKDARAAMQQQQDHEEPQYASRQLKDIVTASTERWMLANDDADAEYYREVM